MDWLSSQTPKAVCNSLGGCCYPPLVLPLLGQANHQMIKSDHNSFGGALNKGIEGFSTPGQAVYLCKTQSREAFIVSFF